MEKITLKQAYLDWVSHRPDGAMKCCSDVHWVIERGESGKYMIMDKEDKDVCARERAWRVYTKIRDGQVQCVAD